jgi:hypothetical protein
VHLKFGYCSFARAPKRAVRVYLFEFENAGPSSVVDVSDADSVLHIESTHLIQQITLAVRQRGQKRTQHGQRAGKKELVHQLRLR